MVLGVHPDCPTESGGIFFVKQVTASVALVAADSIFFGAAA